jgi:hypothetical protein
MLAYSSTLKMEAGCSSDTLIDFQRTTRRYILEERTLHTTAVRISNPTSGSCIWFVNYAVLVSVLETNSGIIISDIGT